MLQQQHAAVTTAGMVCVLYAESVLMLRSLSVTCLPPEPDLHGPCGTALPASPGDP